MFLIVLQSLNKISIIIIMYFIQRYIYFEWTLLSRGIFTIEFNPILEKKGFSAIQCFV